MSENNIRKKFVYEIPPCAHNMRAFDYLRKLQGYSYSAIVKMRHNPASILLDGSPIRTIDRLKSGSTLTVYTIDKQSGEAPNLKLNVPIIYEDEDLLILNKPAGMPCHVSKGHDDDTVSNFYAAHCPGTLFRIIGRLDKDTSGLIIVAKNAHSAKVLTESEIEKSYYAILNGVLVDDKGVIEAPIEDRDPTRRKRYVSPTGRSAKTEYKVLSKNNQKSFVLAHPTTGRTHQLRVHFSYLGAPILGDSLYGEDNALIARQALHRYKLILNHPTKGEKLTFISPPPKDFLDALNALGIPFVKE